MEWFTSRLTGQSSNATSSRKPSLTAPTLSILGWVSVVHVSLEPTSSSQSQSHFTALAESRNRDCLMHILNAICPALSTMENLYFVGGKNEEETEKPGGQALSDSALLHSMTLHQEQLGLPSSGNKEMGDHTGV